MSDKKNRTLYAFYDIIASPLSYDFLGFIIAAETFRRGKGYENIHVIFVPFESDVGHVNNRQFGLDHAMWRFNNVVLPITRFLPACAGFTYCTYREQAHEICPRGNDNVFPAGYTIEEPKDRHHTGWSVIDAHKGHDLQYLRATPEAVSYANQWIRRHSDGKPVVALTLREARFTHSRNSNLQVWGEFAHRIKDKGFFPVVLRDIDTALERTPREFEGIAMFPEGVFNLELRYGFYEKCHICAFVANGPAQASFHNRNIRFLYQVTGDWLENTPTPFNRIGIDFGETPPFANKFQRWIWKEQNADTLMEYFDALDHDIKASQADGSYTSGLDPIRENRLPLRTIGHRFGEWASTGFNLHPQELELAETLLAGEEEEIHFLQGVRVSQMVNQALAMQDIAKAEQLLRALDASHQLTTDFCIRLALICESTHRFNEAAQLYLRAINDGDGSAGSFFRLAKAYEGAGDYERAIEVFELMLEKGARNFMIVAELGAIYEKVRKPDFAYQFYNHWIEAGVSDPVIEHRHSQLARIMNP